MFLISINTKYRQTSQTTTSVSRSETMVYDLFFKAKSPYLHELLLDNHNKPSNGDVMLDTETGRQELYLPQNPSMKVGLAQSHLSVVFELCKGKETYVDNLV